MTLRAVAVCLFMALMAAICWQRGAMISQASRLEQAQAANVSLSKSIGQLRAAREADNLIIVQAAGQSDRMMARARDLELKLREAMNHEADFDRLLSRNVTDALCLRWIAASGANGGDSGDAPGRVDAGTAHTAAGQSDDCKNWTGMSVRDAVEWTGLLLDHAGLERLDKAALRQWTRRNAK